MCSIISKKCADIYIPSGIPGNSHVVQVYQALLTAQVSIQWSQQVLTSCPTIISVKPDTNCQVGNLIACFMNHVYSGQLETHNSP